uniref:AlNc14C170G7993 protein n=1 Tax=Albugo laibachii Nc14 TaxID=890382 RepID=F0WNG8_9STRA|nr:AlNc14C170G7993 [Albugo laibachii Nc14]|eukprot:CCA22859.1 AlNc14C170G7993 [Albugo laibachii Nc14]
MAEFEDKTANKPMHHLRARFVRHLTWHTRRLNGTDKAEITHQDLVDSLTMAIQHVAVFQRLEQAKILSKELGAQMRVLLGIGMLDAL